MRIRNDEQSNKSSNDATLTSLPEKTDGFSSQLQTPTNNYIPQEYGPLTSTPRQNRASNAFDGNSLTADCLALLSSLNLQEQQQRLQSASPINNNTGIDLGILNDINLNDCLNNGNSNNGNSVCSFLPNVSMPVNPNVSNQALGFLNRFPHLNIQGLPPISKNNSDQKFEKEVNKIAHATEGLMQKNYSPSLFNSPSPSKQAKSDSTTIRGRGLICYASSLSVGLQGNRKNSVSSESNFGLSLPNLGATLARSENLNEPSLTAPSRSFIEDALIGLYLFRSETSEAINAQNKHNSKVTTISNVASHTYNSQSQIPCSLNGDSSSSLLSTVPSVGSLATSSGQRNGWAHLSNSQIPHSSDGNSSRSLTSTVPSAMSLPSSSGQGNSWVDTITNSCTSHLDFISCQSNPERRLEDMIAHEQDYITERRLTAEVFKPIDRRLNQSVCVDEASVWALCHYGRLKLEQSSFTDPIPVSTSSCHNIEQFNAASLSTPSAKTNSSASKSMIGLNNAFYLDSSIQTCSSGRTNAVQGKPATSDFKPQGFQLEAPPVQASVSTQHNLKLSGIPTPSSWNTDLLDQVETFVPSSRSINQARALVTLSSNINHVNNGSSSQFENQRQTPVTSHNKKEQFHTVPVSQLFPQGYIHQTPVISSHSASRVCSSVTSGQDRHHPVQNFTRPPPDLDQIQNINPVYPQPNHVQNFIQPPQVVNQIMNINPIVSHIDQVQTFSQQPPGVDQIQNVDAAFPLTDQMHNFVTSSQGIDEVPALGWSIDPYSVLCIPTNHIEPVLTCVPSALNEGIPSSVSMKLSNEIEETLNANLLSNSITYQPKHANQNQSLPPMPPYQGDHNKMTYTTALSIPSMKGNNSWSHPPARNTLINSGLYPASQVNSHLNQASKKCYAENCIYSPTCPAFEGNESAHPGYNYYQNQKHYDHPPLPVNANPNGCSYCRICPFCRYCHCPCHCAYQMCSKNFAKYG